MLLFPADDAAAVASFAAVLPFSSGGGVDCAMGLLVPTAVSGADVPSYLLLCCVPFRELEQLEVDAWLA